MENKTLTRSPIKPGVRTYIEREMAAHVAEPRVSTDASHATRLWLLTGLD